MHSTEPNTGIDLLDAIYQLRGSAMSAQRRLDRASAALAYVGMERLADELDDIGNMMVAHAKAVQDAHGLHLNTELRRSEEATANMLQAALVGIIGPAPKQEESADA